MEWVERLNKAIDYIEEHLTKEINYDEIAKIACCSTYHFQRMFAYMANMPLSEYIRRRCMTMAAFDLQNSNNKIIDIALKYGYSSPTAFNRAFQNIHGIAPSYVNKEGVSLKNFSPISFKITIKGVEGMNYRIENRNEFRIIGISQQLDKDIEKNFITIPEMWETATTSGIINKLIPFMDSKPKGILGVTACNNDTNWRYYICVSSNNTNNDFEEYVIPACLWAIFTGNGSNKSIQNLEKRIITEWLPTSGYEYANAPDIELYLNSDPENMQYEVWIPVTKKEM